MITIIIFITMAVVIWYFVKIRSTNKSCEERQSDLTHKTADDRAIKIVGDFLAKIEAIKQADIIGNETIKDAILNETYTGPLPERRSDGGWLSIFDNLRILKIAGINYQEGINRYVGRVNCALVPEPDNEYDPDAIKIVAEDRHHLGYIPSGQTELVCSLTANEFPYRCTAFIEECEDEDDGHKFFIGYVYIQRLD
jgi:preprotein translocase subunit YajC